MERLGVGWRAAVLVLVVLGTIALACVLSARTASATCPRGCDYCSADPVFVQPDLRSPEMVEMIRQAKARGAAVAEKKGMVVTIE